MTQPTRQGARKAARKATKEAKRQAKGAKLDNKLQDAIRRGLLTYDADTDTVTPTETVWTTALFLDEYIRSRSEVEGVEYGLCPHFFANHLMAGFLFFFGVEVCGCCLMPKEDAQEPYPGFFEEFVTELEFSDIAE